VVVILYAVVNHRGTEDTEVAQRRLNTLDNDAAKCYKIHIFELTKD